MSLWVCAECTAAYSVGAPRCPQCRSTDHYEEGQDMPKITVHGGPTIAGVTGAWGDEDDAPASGSSTEGSEPSSPSSSSGTSSEKPSTESATSESGSPKPARRTANRSARGRTGSSSAPSTGGGRTAATSASDGEDSGGAGDTA